MKAIWVPVFTALVAVLPVTDCRAAAPVSAESLAPARVIVYQPVQEYFTPVAGGPAGDLRDYTSLYTHIGTDFGRMGPGESRLGSAWRNCTLVLGHGRGGDADHPPASGDRKRADLGLSAAGACESRLPSHRLFAARLLQLRTLRPGETRDRRG